MLEERIRGTDGGRHVEVDAVGHEIKVIKHFPPIPGSNVYLTIDLGLQLAAMRALEGKAGAVIAMDPKTGEDTRYGKRALIRPEYDHRRHDDKRMEGSR